MRTAAATATASTNNDETLQAQLSSLQDADTYATAWATALQAASESRSDPLRWGGRGQGGRGRARRTWQPRTVVVEPLSLTYLRTADGTPSRTLLDDTVLRVHPGHVYALVGRNGAGKSSLLQHVHAKTLTGFPPHVSTFLVAQQEDRAASDDQHPTVQEYLHQVYANFQQQSTKAQQYAVEELEAAMDALDLETAQGQEEMEALSQQLAALDDAATSSAATDLLEKDWHQALEFMGLSVVELAREPWNKLSPGQRQKVRLAAILLCPCQLVLLDEPSQQLDIPGLWRLRRLIHLCQVERQSTVVLASHDVDLINDVVTDVIDWRKQKLHYYAGNYFDYEFQRDQETAQHQRQIATVTRKKQAVKETLQHIKEQNPSRRKGGAKKKAKQLSAQRQKMSRVTADERAAQAQLEDGENDHGSIDKSIQFVFRNPRSQWHEPLILAYGLGHGYGEMDTSQKDVSPITEENGQVIIRKQDGFLFDYVDLCIEESGTYAIVGPSACGKTTLLRLLAGLEKPVEGEVKYAHNVDVAFVNDEPFTEDHDATTLTYLMRRFPQKTEQEIRGEMTNFGLGPAVTSTRLAFLSGGERARLRLTALLLDEPDVLLWDDPSAHLDPSGVLALIKGLKEWKGTLVVVSHDSFFLRELEASCWAIVPDEGKLRRIEGGVDVYLRSFVNEMQHDK